MKTKNKKVSQVTFIAIKPTWVSINPRRYLINTNCIHEALAKAEQLLKKEKHAERYKALPVLIMDIHDA